LINTINKYTRQKKPFLFIIDFEVEKPIIRLLSDINPKEILYDFKGFTNYNYESRITNYESRITNYESRITNYESQFHFSKFPITYKEYKKKFDRVKEQLLKGNSYLLNLTFPTPIKTTLSLREIFIRSNAPYKLLYTPNGGRTSDTKFVVFSPESFVRIKKGIISSFPMKGTINALVPNAENVIINDEKELAEHSTIVDLIRNDLSKVATRVRLDKFRYIERIKTYNSELLQVSSEIKGKVRKELLRKFGTLLSMLLPAGSISGAPKRKTVEIIKQTEGYERGYYTGVFGYSDGETLESAVMIRYIEETNENLCFKSGGGITIYSNPRSEYQELIDKVYVPFN
jgi:para-aminobenzoate synthetase component 1